VIKISEYQEAWPQQFRHIARTLRTSLGDSALRIDHIGSTAVPGLAAKDILDIQISVASFDDPLLERLSALGYSRDENFNRDHRPPGDQSPDSHWHKWFFRAPLGQRPTNTHVRILGNANQLYALLFRDYLRSHPATATAYANLKRELALELRDDSRYPDVKGPAVHVIYLAAVDWAASTGWHVGPSDA